MSPFDSMFKSLELLAIGSLLVIAVSLAGGFALAVGLRLRGLRWTWSVAFLPVAVLLGLASRWMAVAAFGACVVACLVGMAWQALDLAAGGDRTKDAEARLGVLAAVGHAIVRWEEAQRGWLHNGYLTVGHDRWGERVSIPAGEQAGSHALIVGATGTGKTSGEAWIAARLIEHGHGAVAIDPKGEGLLREELRLAAERAGRRFYEWTPEGPCAYNPYAHGGDDEIAEKALGGETFTEPHYLRQAQRYLGQAVRAMRAAGVPVTAGSLTAHMDPARLDATARGGPSEEEGRRTRDYVNSLTERQRRDLAGVRDRLAILAESDVAPWLDPGQAEWTIGLHGAIQERAVVYFSLESDRRPILARMLARAIVTDLVVLTAELQRNPIPTVVLLDEFSATGAQQIARLFGRGRSAGISLLLTTQELADLAPAGQLALRDQVIGNVETVIAYRQNVPDSAELLAAIAGTSPTWIATQQTGRGLLKGLPTGRTLRRRDHEYDIHPSEIKRLHTGQALVVTPTTGQPPKTARMLHPSEVRRRDERRPSQSPRPRSRDSADLQGIAAPFDPVEFS
jgi:hypothetical protein